MIFEKKNKWETRGEIFGYLFSYSVFTLILFIALTFFKKMPVGWNYIHVIALTLFIVLIGTSLKEWLK
ncbi:MAG: hypothetical protein COT90_01740 [Candidatus Diapherotrites archaeon CG10_big_fil_rev_8_21_14_0_10_31_34]|nr:MAG: hypothetical protein COT90_01740 [Candidatus Diapherotrites archaeon CG10_big_fil_rev_8_21_14_0_10_31_34]